MWNWIAHGSSQWIHDFLISTNIDRNRDMFTGMRQGDTHVLPNSIH